MGNRFSERLRIAGSGSHILMDVGLLAVEQKLKSVIVGTAEVENKRKVREKKKKFPVGDYPKIQTFLLHQSQKGKPTIQEQLMQIKKNSKEELIHARDHGTFL